MVVVHGYLGDAEAVLLDLGHELHTDHAGVARQLDALEHRSPEEPEVAVDVDHVQAEGEPHDVMVDAADDDPVERVGARDLVAVHEIGVRPVLPQRAELAHVVLRVAVGVEDVLLRGGSEAGAERPAVAAVPLVLDDAQVGHVPQELAQDQRGVIRTRVVHHDDLPVVGQIAHDGRRQHDETRYGSPVIVGGKEDRHPGTRGSPRIARSGRAS